MQELKIINIEDLNNFKENIVVKRFIERNIELALEQMVDICKHFVSGLDLKEPETYSECFDILAKNNIIPHSTVNTFKSMVKYRNLLIHAYGEINDSITYSIFTKHIDDFRVFIKVIRDYLRSAMIRNCSG